MRRFIVILMTTLMAFIVMPEGLWAQAGKADLYMLEAHRQIQLGNEADAYELFKHAQALNPNSAMTLSELAQFANLLENDSLAVALLKRSTELAPDNYWYKEWLVNLLVSKNRNEEAVKELEKMSEQYPEKTTVMLMLEEMYQENKDYENAIKILDRLEVKEGKSEALSMEKFRMYVTMNDKKKAFQEMTELAAEYPNDLRYRVLIGDLYVDQEQYDEGLKIYQEVETQEPTNPYLIASMLNYYNRTGQDSLYKIQQEKICTSPQLDENTRYSFLNSLVRENLQKNSDPTNLIKIFDKVMAMPQEDNEILMLYARYLLTIQQPKDKVKPVLRQMLDIDPENDLAREQLLQYAVEDDDTLGIIGVCKPAVDIAMKNPVYYYYLGVAYFQCDSSRLALDAFKRGLQKSDNQTNLQMVTNMYTLMGDVYHDLGDNKNAYVCYDSCLLYRPDDALVLNNYAYYLSLDGKMLDKAEEMSRRSLTKEPNSPTYLDTYAWILFRQKKYAEAKEYIDKALELMGDEVDEGDANVIEHAGDIYAKNGLKEQAMLYWEKSARLGNGSMVLLKKIAKKKYLVK